jgi:hypothetical protein
MRPIFFGGGAILVLNFCSCLEMEEEEQLSQREMMSGWNKIEGVER